MSAKSVVNKISRLVSGREIFDPVPVAAPIGWKKPKSIQEMMAKYLRDANEYASRSGHETFEEAEDFDVDDSESQFESPWETDFDHVSGREMYKPEKAALDKHRAQFDAYVKSQRKKPKAKSPGGNAPDPKESPNETD